MRVISLSLLIGEKRELRARGTHLATSVTPVQVDYSSIIELVIYSLCWDRIAAIMFEPDYDNVIHLHELCKECGSTALACQVGLAAKRLFVNDVDLYSALWQN